MIFIRWLAKQFWLMKLIIVISLIQSHSLSYFYFLQFDEKHNWTVTWILARKQLCIQIAQSGMRYIKLFTHLQKHSCYYTLQSSLQIQHPALLDDETSHAHYLTPGCTCCNKNPPHYLSSGRWGSFPLQQGIDQIGTSGGRGRNLRTLLQTGTGMKQGSTGLKQRYRIIRLKSPNITANRNGKETRVHRAETEK